MIFAKYFRRATRPDAAEVAGMPATASLKIFNVDPSEAGNAKKTILAKWKKLVLNK